MDVNAEGQLGVTGLHWAARADQAELAEFWIEHGADVNARTRQSHSHSPGATPLDYAESRERKRVAEVLRRHGARRG